MKKNWFTNLKENGAPVAKMLILSLVLGAIAGTLGIPFNPEDVM